MWVDNRWISLITPNPVQDHINAFNAEMKLGESVIRQDQRDLLNQEMLQQQNQVLYGHNRTPASRSINHIIAGNYPRFSMITLIYWLASVHLHPAIEEAGEPPREKEIFQNLQTVWSSLNNHETAAKDAFVSMMALINEAPGPRAQPLSDTQFTVSRYIYIMGALLLNTLLDIMFNVGWCFVIIFQLYGSRGRYTKQSSSIQRPGPSFDQADWSHYWR